MTDGEARGLLRAAWLRAGWRDGDPCCGSRGLAIGCPGCGRVWPWPDGR